MAYVYVNNLRFCIKNGLDFRLVQINIGHREVPTSYITYCLDTYKAKHCVKVHTITNYILCRGGIYVSLLRLDKVLLYARTRNSVHILCTKK